MVGGQEALLYPGRENPALRSRPGVAAKSITLLLNQPGGYEPPSSLLHPVQFISQKILLSPQLFLSEADDCPGGLWLEEAVPDMAQPSQSLQGLHL